MLCRLYACERGTTAIEYALIATIISVIAIASMLVIGGSVNTFFTNAANGFR
ncbi:MAG: Flp family type IVb pilin [Alphaproteobacteria bacterium]